MKNINNVINYNEKNKNCLVLHRTKDNNNMFNNNCIFKKNNDKRRLLHLVLLEFIKKNNKHNDNLILESSNYINSFVHQNNKIQIKKMKKQFEKRLNSTYLKRSDICNSFYKKKELDISSNGKNSSILLNNFKGNSVNSSFNNHLKNPLNKNKGKKISIPNRIYSTIGKNKFKNDELFSANRFEEDITIDYLYGRNSNELKNNNIIYIRKKPDKPNLNDFNKVPNIQKELISNGNFKCPNIMEEKKNQILKKNQSLPNMNKNKISYLSMHENKRKTKKIIEYIYDNNINATFHFQSIKFGIGQNINNFKTYKNYINNEKFKEEQEEIIVKAFRNKKYFLNKELMYNYLKYKSKINSKENQISSNIRMKTEENKNNSTNKIDENSKDNNNHHKCLVIENNDKRMDTKTFYKKKYDKLDIKTSILHLKEVKNYGKNKNNNKYLINKKRIQKDKIYLTAKTSFVNYNKINKNKDQTPVTINRYVTKRRKNNNDDIIGLI